MEKKDRPYTVLPYDPNWAELFEREKQIISDIFGDDAVQIEHIGSTSVPGLWAKPQIDILIVVETLAVVDNYIQSMTAAGYNHHPDFLQFNEQYFTRDEPTGERTVSIHIRTPDNPEAGGAIIFRDYLRSHPAERDLYSDAKRQSYNDGQTDRVQYSKGKKEVLELLLKHAQDWHQSNN